MYAFFNKIFIQAFGNSCKIALQIAVKIRDIPSFCIIYNNLLLAKKGSTLGQKSSIYQEMNILKILLFTKFTISKSHFSQNSHFQSLIFHKIHIFKVSFFTKFTFLKSHFSQNSHF